MKNTFLILFFLPIILFGCNEQIKRDNNKTDIDKKDKYISEKLKLNKKKYIIKKDEIIKIYYTYNSCCPLCSPRLNELKNSKFLFSKQETKSNGCIGCTDLHSLSFKGISKGIDTIYMTALPPIENCDSIKDYKDFRTYIIIVK